MYHVIRLYLKGVDQGFVVVTDIFLSLWSERIKPIISFDTKDQAERWAKLKY